MLRTLSCAAALAAAATVAIAEPPGAGHGPVYGEGHPHDYTPVYGEGYPPAAAPHDEVSGLTVYVQPRDAYVIRIDTRGKDERTVHREIAWAAREACARAPRTANVLDTRPSAVSACVGQASHDARRQFDRIQARRAYYQPAGY